jgi:hypothetical protein
MRNFKCYYNEKNYIVVNKKLKSRTATNTAINSQQTHRKIKINKKCQVFLITNLI